MNLPSHKSINHNWKKKLVTSTTVKLFYPPVKSDNWMFCTVIYYVYWLQMWTCCELYMYPRHILVYPGHSWFFSPLSLLISPESLKVQFFIHSHHEKLLGRGVLGCLKVSHFFITGPLRKNTSHKKSKILQERPTSSTKVGGGVCPIDLCVVLKPPDSKWHVLCGVKTTCLCHISMCGKTNLAL